jgi:hypothetical protein
MSFQLQMLFIQNPLSYIAEGYENAKRNQPAFVE